MKQGHNLEYMEEKRKKREAEEKKIGILTFLGQSVADAKGAPLFHRWPFSRWLFGVRWAWRGLGYEYANDILLLP